MSTYTRYFAFTLNNYTEQEEQALQEFAKRPSCVHLCYGREVAPSTGTKHLQGCVAFKSKTRCATVFSRIGVKRLHIEPCKKVYEANMAYCKKCNDVWEYPDNFMFKKEVKVGRRQKYKEALDLAKKGDFKSIDAEILIRHSNQLRKIYSDNVKCSNLYFDNKYGNFFGDHFVLLHGPTGTGKSYRVQLFIEGINYWYRRYCQDEKMEYKPMTVYYKKCNKWFDGYLDQDIVVIEELEPGWVSVAGNLLKQLCDQYPFAVEVKGASLDKIRPKFVIMTSNYDLRTLCTDSKGNLVNEVYLPLKRRIKSYLVNSTYDKIVWPNPNNLLRYWSTLELVRMYYVKNVNEYIESSIKVFNQEKYFDEMQQLIEEDQRLLNAQQEEAQKMYEEVKLPEELEFEDKVEKYDNNFNNYYLDSMQAEASTSNSGYYTQESSPTNGNFLPSPRHE